MCKALCVLAAFAVVSIPVGCGGDDDGASAQLTLVTDIDFRSEPFEGTFEVTEGTDELGCSAGTFVDENVDEQSVNKVATCTAGERSGSFVILFHPTGEEDDVSNWEFVRGTGDFAGIEGEGDFSVDYSEEDDDPDSGVETLTGDVSFE